MAKVTALNKQPLGSLNPRGNVLDLFSIAAWTTFQLTLTHFFAKLILFTDKRLIVIDSQGFTGQKKEIYSLPYKSIVMWSTENAGILDVNSEVQLWTRVGNIKINLGKKVDIRQFDKILQEVCL